MLAMIRSTAASNSNSLTSQMAHQKCEPLIVGTLCPKLRKEVRSGWVRQRVLSDLLQSLIYRDWGGRITCGNKVFYQVSCCDLKLFPEQDRPDI